MSSCCDKAIDNGTLVYKGRTTIVCPTCGKDQMLKLVWFHDCGYEYIDGKGLKKTKAKQKEGKMNLWKIIPHRHIYRLGDYSGKRCRRCGRFRKLEQKDK